MCQLANLKPSGKLAHVKKPKRETRGKTVEPTPKENSKALFYQKFYKKTEDQANEKKQEPDMKKSKKEKGEKNIEE